MNDKKAKAIRREIRQMEEAGVKFSVGYEFVARRSLRGHDTVQIICHPKSKRGIYRRTKQAIRAGLV